MTFALTFIAIIMIVNLITEVFRLKKAVKDINKALKSLQDTVSEVQFSQANTKHDVHFMNECLQYAITVQRIQLIVAQNEAIEREDYKSAEICERAIDSIKNTIRSSDYTIKKYNL